MAMINQSSGSSRSYWVPKTRSQEYTPLVKDIRVDVAIVGAGIAGLSTAYALTRFGRSVAVIEDGLIGSGETERTSAHLTAYVDGGLFRLKQFFGIKTLRLVIDSHIAAINHIEAIAEEEGFSCEFKRVNGYLFSGDETKDILLTEASVLKEISNFPFEWLDNAPLKNFRTGSCLKLPQQAQFHPMKYLEGLAQAIVRRNGQIFEGSHITSIEDGTPCRLKTIKGVQITANDVVVATNSPINDRLLLQTKQAQYRTYVICIAIPKAQMEEALYWDTLDPYHYIRVVPSPKEDIDYVLIGGEDERTGHHSPQKALSALKKWIAKRFLKHTIVYEWSGQIIEPVDMLAFIGRNPGDKHIFVHTGTSGNGLTYGSISGILLPDLITGKNSPLEAVYDPSRKTVQAIPQFVKNTCSMVAQYSDWLKPQSGPLDRLSSNEGVVVRNGFQPQAVYKDSNGKLHHMSAICPHLGGLVRWNSFEKTWDCPCHGSRFSNLGEVINGPANLRLKKVK